VTATRTFVAQAQRLFSSNVYWQTEDIWTCRDFQGKGDSRKADRSGAVKGLIVHKRSYLLRILSEVYFFVLDCHWSEAC
jgi:hypothetical protein